MTSPSAHITSIKKKYEASFMVHFPRMRAAVLFDLQSITRILKFSWRDLGREFLLIHGVIAVINLDQLG